MIQGISKAVLNDLTASIKKYYTASTDSGNEEYSGFQLIDKIVADKINAFTSDTLPVECYDLIKLVKASFENFTLHVKYYSFFPSYVITIELVSREIDYIKHICWLNVKVSMLTPYFTIYFEDQNWFNNFYDFKGSYKPLYFKVLSTINTFYDPKEILFENLKKLTQSCFPNYKYVSHKLLLDTKMKTGTPFGKYEDIIEPHSIYSFLFDNDTQLPTTIIVQ